MFPSPNEFPNKRYRTDSPLPDYGRFSSINDIERFNYKLVQEPPPQPQPVYQAYPSDSQFTRDKTFTDELRYLDEARRKLMEKEYDLIRRESKFDEREKHFNKCRKEHIDKLNYMMEWENHNLRLADVKHSQKKYKFCKRGIKCNYPNCGFAHSKEELTIPYKLFWCTFGKKCKNYNRDSDMCPYSHGPKEWLEHYSYDEFIIRHKNDVRETPKSGDTENSEENEIAKDITK